MPEITPVFLEEYLNLHAADLADRLQRLDADEARALLRQLPADKAAAAAGVMIPLGLKAFRLDPALASSIFLTTVTDVAGFFFFLGLATLGLKYLHG